MYLRYANTVGDTWKRSFSVSLPVKDHRVLVRGNENSAIRKVDHDGKVVSIESITKELARDLNSIVSWRERERERRSRRGCQFNDGRLTVDVLWWEELVGRIVDGV